MEEDMDESAEQRIDFPIERSTPAGVAHLESILRSEELRRRPSRPPGDIEFPMSKGEEAEAEIRELERVLKAKIRGRGKANVVGIVMWSLEPLHRHDQSERPHLDGVITSANDAFLGMVQYDRGDLASGRLRWTDLTPDEWRGHDEQAVADLEATGIFQPFEKEYFRKDGTRVPVLLGGALFEASGNDGVAFVLDLSDQE
jgi:PAS domain-containing protein